jgi:hypothetical protein
MELVDIAKSKQSVDLVAIVEGAGVELKRQGKRHVGHCPFHDDAHPSFVVFEKRFYCFGCHEHGDVIDFVMRKHGLSFREALKQLGFDTKAVPTGPLSKAYEDRSLKKDLIRKFREWEVDYSNELGLLLRLGHSVLKELPLESDLRAWLSEQLPVWQHRLEILASGDDQLKYELWKWQHGRR